MEWINFRHLYAFWAVCRHGGFRKAAERVHVSQSTISEQVALLEDYLGESLLDRSTRSVNVTDRGAALLEYAEAIFAKSYEINHIFRDKNASMLTATVRIGMVGGISRNFLFRRLMRIMDRAAPRIELMDGSFDELNELLRRFELDLIFSLEPPRAKDLLTVRHQRVLSSPLCLAGTPALMRRILASHNEPAELYMFRHPFEGDPLEEVIAAQLGVAVEVPIWTDDISLLRFLANGGRGLSVVPEIGVREDLEAGRVEVLPITGDIGIDVYAVYLAKGVRRQIIETLLA